MRIALINVCGRQSSEGSRLISALLKRAGHQVCRVFLTRVHPVPYTHRELARLGDLLADVDLVLVAVYSAYAGRAVQVSQVLRRRFPSVPVVWGGPHCVASPEHALRHADGACFGEGDAAVVEFVDRLAAGDDRCWSTPGMAFRRPDGDVVNEPRPPLEDLDGLPHDDFGLDDSYLLDGDLLPMTRQRLRDTFVVYPFGEPTFWALSARGCPHHCSYCNNCRYLAMFGRNALRLQSMDRFCDELAAHLDRLPMFRRVAIADDDFLCRPLHDLERFAARYRAEVGLPFSVFVSARTFDRRKLDLLRDAGLAIVQMGVQSGSDRVLREVYDRDLSVAATRRVVDELEPLLRDGELELLLDFIVDNPYETPADVLATLRDLSDLPRGARPNLFTLSWFPGTPLYARAVADGIVRAEDEEAYRHFSGMVRYHRRYETLLVLALGRALRSGVPGARGTAKVLASGPLRAMARGAPLSAGWSLAQRARLAYGAVRWMRIVARSWDGT